ncbi:pre-rRNA processing and 40S ribosomal subunit assembly [Halocaridina rubra]|uniref:Pre-rRNA processing and 40S ribosomal subunit assembly n=1 Tax=Halocaridina rubra TaxID=373956 RepID=A0AAN9AB94_HALRR
MDNKDEILANFQACSGIEDVGEAFMHLEAANWNMLEALQVVMPPEATPSASVPIPPLHAASNPEIISVDSSPELLIPPPIPPLPAAIPSTSAASFSSSSSTSPVMDVNIKVLCAGVTEGSSFPLELPKATSVSELRTMLHQLVGINPCNQILEGFKKPVEDSTVITPAILPESRTLTLNAQAAVSFDNFYERMNGAHDDNYMLLIHDETNSKDYSLRFEGRKRIKEIKNDVFDLTCIAVRHQHWTGWPPNVDDEATLTSSGIAKQHHLTIRELHKNRTPKAQRKAAMEVGGENNSSGDEFEDAPELVNDDDDFLDMMDVPSSKKPQTLIPADIDDEIMGVIHFTEEFRNRYGNCVPMFFQGSLEDALKESVLLPAKSRKLLAVYLHHDGSVLSNVFCSQALCQISVVDYLSANFLVWGWDLTHEANKVRLLNLVSTHFGGMAASTVRSFSVDKLPALLVITRTRGMIEVLSVIHGNGVLDEVMTSLLHAMEMFEEQRATEVQEEEAREAREAVKAEQDAAYMESLAADRAKAEAKKKAEDEEKKERERVESIKLQEEAIKEAVRASLETDIPDEPGPDCLEAVSTLRFRIPGGETFTRNFLANTRIQVLLNFLHVKGYPADEYKCLQSWPRRDISSLDPSKTLQDYKLCPQETLNLEER